MTSPAAQINWAEANQRYLMARLALVRNALARQAANAGQISAETHSHAEAEAGLREAAQALPAPSALDHLCQAFGLSAFERDVLLLCAGIELDSGFAALCAAAQSSSRNGLPTFSLALAVLPDAHWSALAPAAPLRRWRLLELSAGDTLTQSPLRIDERVLHYLAGVGGIDARLNGLVELLAPPPELPPSHQQVAEQIVHVWSQSGRRAAAWPVIHLMGEDDSGRRAIAAAASAALRQNLYVMRAADLPASAAEREALARLWERESALSSATLLLDCNEAENHHAITSFIEQMQGPLMISSREPLRPIRRSLLRLTVRRPGATEQRQLWQSALGSLSAQLDHRLDRLVSQFSLGIEAIRAVSAQTIDSSSDDDGLIGLRLWDACRQAASAQLDALAQRIEPMADWSDLVLPEAQMQTLREIAAQAHQRQKVYESWGFAAKSARGLGLSALFAGASGTGKTMAAEVIARELRLDLYRIDLSQVVSKYIGETEKNLRRVFDAAEAGGAVLLFDEADALFGKRSEVKDSHDRYANIEISYLLQRMEEYRGLAILTTNQKSVLDTAFLRRLRFVVQFPFPDATLRAEIWRRIFPPQTPVANLDVNKLARLNVAGGNIRNIALQAAFLAADANEPVQMKHLLRAARGEYTKLEKTLTDSECRDWIGS
ncbi:MAG: ATP-binding protein [Blastocatellia bacterium]